MRALARRPAGSRRRRPLRSLPGVRRGRPLAGLRGGAARSGSRRRGHRSRRGAREGAVARGVPRGQRRGHCPTAPGRGPIGARTRSSSSCRARLPRARLATEGRSRKATPPPRCPGMAARSSRRRRRWLRNGKGPGSSSVPSSCTGRETAVCSPFSRPRRKAGSPSRPAGRGSSSSKRRGQRAPLPSSPAARTSRGRRRFSATRSPSRSRTCRAGLPPFPASPPGASRYRTPLVRAAGFAASLQEAVTGRALAFNADKAREILAGDWLCRPKVDAGASDPCPHRFPWTMVLRKPGTGMSAGGGSNCKFC